MLAGGETQEKVAREVVKDERDAVVSAEMAIDPSDRARLERAVSYGASELRINTPRLRFFDGRKFSFGGIHFREWPNEVWVDGTRTLPEMKLLGLHETQHIQHFADDLGADLPAEHRHELRERDADRFSRRGAHW